MERFHANAARIGDHSLAQDDHDPAVERNKGVVVKVVETASCDSNDVGIRLLTAATPLRARHHAVYLLPLDRRFPWWRYDTTTTRVTPAEPHDVAA